MRITDINHGLKGSSALKEYAMVRKRANIPRKPKDLRALHSGHVVAFETIEIFIYGLRRYITTREDI